MKHQFSYLNNFTEDSPNLLQAYHYAGEAGINISFVHAAINKWSTISNYTSEQLFEYAAYYYWQQVFNNHIRFLQRVIILVICFLGIIGGVIEVIVLTSAEFKTPSFLYHKFIVFMDVMVMISCTVYRFYLLFGKLHDGDYLIVFVVAFENMFSFASKMMSLFVCVERVVALFLPHHFNWINRNRIVCAAGFLSALFAALYAIDFWSPLFDTTSVYRNYTWHRSNIGLAQAVTMLIAAVTVVVGLMNLTRLQRKTHQGSDEHSKNLSKLNFQLALLSLSCAIPNLLNTLIMVISNNLCLFVSNTQSSCSVGNSAVMLPFDVAVRYTHNMVVFTILSTVNNIVWIFAHSSHFYLYVLLSPRFRKPTLTLLTTGRLPDPTGSGTGKSKPGKRPGAGVPKTPMVTTKGTTHVNSPPNWSPRDSHEASPGLLKKIYHDLIERLNFTNKP